MAFTYKVLGQVAPSATTDTTAYTVPAGKQAIISTITIANRSASASSYRIAVRPDGATISNEHYLAYDIAIAANDTTVLTIGLTVDAGDVITVYGLSANLSFGIYGSEIS